uniref:hypothetical protein n=1 Tax=Staphylococcus epidermidis TaxID=1282 RepID=UPI001642485B
HFYPTLLKPLSQVYKINIHNPYKKFTHTQKNILINPSPQKQIQFTFTQPNPPTPKPKILFQPLLPNIHPPYHQSPSQYTPQII